MTGARRIVLSATAILVAAITAHAAPTLTAIVTASGYAGDGWSDYVGAPQINHHALDVVPANALSTVEFAVEQTGTPYPVSGEDVVVFARAGGSAGMGHLHAFADSDGHCDATHLNYYGMATGDTRVGFTDTIMVQPSATHPAGEWVAINAKLVVDKTIAYGPGAQVIMGASLNVQGAHGYDAQDGSGNPFGCNNTLYDQFYAEDQVLGNNLSRLDEIGYFIVGTTYTIYGDLEAQVTAQVGNTYYGALRDSSGSVNVLNTSHSYVWSDDPTVVVTTGSGASYAPPVPEPTSLTMLILSAALLGRRRSA